LKALWKWLAGVAIIALLLSAALFGFPYWLDTSSGHRFITRQVAAFEFENGLNIRIGQIEGSIYGKAELVDVRLQDDKGTFATVPRAALDWHPFDYFYGRLSIDAFTANEAFIRRLPELRVIPDRGEPFFPDLDIRIDRLQLDHIVFDKSITGQEHVLGLQAKARIVDTRALVDIAAQTQQGDRLTARLDAIPDKDRLDMALLLDGPADGLASGLMGINAPVKAKLDGKGSWTRWAGTVKAEAGGNRSADLAISATNGKFSANGEIVPGAVSGDNMLGNLLAPKFKVDLVADYQNRVAKIVGNLVSDKGRLDADGTVDLNDSRFENMAVNFRMPGRVSLSGGIDSQGTTGRLLIDGPIASPQIDYTVNADLLRWGEFSFYGLNAKGVARSAGDFYRIPVSARARRMTGFDVTDKRILDNIRLDGDLAYNDGRLLSERLSLRSDRISASLKGVADFSKGQLAASIKGKIDRYRIESVGLFDIDADLGLKSRMRDDYALSGTVRARSTQLFSDGVRDFLGGRMLVRAGIGLTEKGVLRITSAQMTAPKLRLNSGSGSYVMDSGALRFTGSGYSTEYGPVGVAVTGTLTDPITRVTAKRPGLGIGLADLSALVTRTPHGFSVLFDAATDYGPVDGDIDILSGTQNLVLDVKRANFAGIVFGGRLQQMAAGPFAGQLIGQGAGFDGIADLSAQGRYQRAVIKATATDAVLQGQKTLRIGRGMIDADIVLFEQPQLLADVQLGNSSIDELFIGAARGKIDYRNGQGNAQFLVEGQSTFPFRIAANSRLEPKLWTVALRGRANGVAFTSATPVRIVPEQRGYTILPSSIKVGNGTVRLEGRYADALQIRSKIENVNLAVFNPMLPGFELAGRATGLIDWKQSSTDAIPQAQGRVEIKRFRRNSLGAPSQPVDLFLQGNLDASGGGLSAVIQRQRTKVGRLQVKLGALPDGPRDWFDKVLDAPLSGGIRYNGPSDLLFSLATLANQSLVGPVAVAADFSGNLREPMLTGSVRSDNLVYENETYGTRLTKLRVRGVFSNDVLNLTEISAKAGEGSVSGQGVINLSFEKGFPAKIDLDLEKARLAKSELITTAATGQIEVTNSPGNGALVSGTLALPETRFRIIRQNAASVTTLTGIRRKSATGPTRITGDANPVSSLPSNWKLDIKLVASDELYISGMGLESEWKADLRVTGTSDMPFITGDLQLVRGTLGFAGRSFGIETGRLTFNGGEFSNPSLRVIAAAEVDGTTVRVEVRGTGNKPDIAFSSTPALPQDEIMARILFGNSVAELSAIQAVQLAASLNSLRAAPGGLNPLGVLQSATGLDRLRILNADEQAGRGTAISLGQYITNDVYVEIITDARGYTASQIEISLTPALSILSQLSSYGTSNVSVRYRKDY
jgi:translocation and assembly module TamB